jgi:hypothetical protein
VFGTWNGLIICLAGSILGNMMVFVALRQFSTTLDHIFPKRAKKRGVKKSADADPVKKRKLPFFLYPESLNRMPHPEIVAFYVYLIPGIPNGVLPHIFARTKVSFGRYLIAVVAGNAPSTLVCTLVGDRLAKGDFFGAVIIILVFSACIGVALMMRRKLITLISGGYSLNLGSSDKNDDAALAQSSEGVEANASMNTKEPAATNAHSETLSGDSATSAKSVVETRHGESAASLSSGLSAVPDGAVGEADAEKNLEDTPAASGTDNIVPHGWRILKGRKE